MNAEEQPATDLVTYDDEIGLERLQRRPIIDRIDQRQLALIKRTIAVAEGDQAITDAELGHFLELSALYGLDPFAREAWIAKSKRGKLLIMVGRDGLRKIAQRNGIHVDGDVVRKADTLLVTRGADGNRTIEHSWTAPAERGEIIGAWAECREGGPLGRPLGFFYAPLSEYKPAGASEYSPWSKQEGVMILAAAERQAIRQATPLGGLLAEGEDESAAAAAAIGSGEGSGEGPGWGEMPGELVERIEAIIARASKAGLPALATPEVIQMRLKDQSAEDVEAWIRVADAQVAAVEDVPEAEVVE